MTHLDKKPNMQSVMTNVESRRVEISVPDDWPDGIQVKLIPISIGIGIVEADFPSTPEGIRFLLNEMDNAGAAVESVEFNFEWTEWNEYQRDAVRQSLGEPIS